MILHLFCVFLPLGVFSQSDMYAAKPWVPKNISPAVAEFIQLPAPKSRQFHQARSYPRPAPVYTPYEKPPAYVQNAGYIRKVKDQQTSGSYQKPLRVARPPVTSRNFQTQLTPPRPNLPPPVAAYRPSKMYRGAMARNDVVLTDREDESDIVVEEEEEASTLVNFGDWAAQWDEIEEAWYFYNYLSGESSWDKPEDLADLRFENPFGSTYETDSAQIPSPLTAQVPGYETPVSNSLLVPEDGYFGNGYGNIVGNGEYIDEYDIGEYDIDKAADDSSSGTTDTGILSFLGLKNLKKRFGIKDILGIKLKDGGSIKKALSKNLSELSLYKNVAKDFVETFLIKVTGWAVISMFIYGNNILSAKRRRRSTRDTDLSPPDYLSNTLGQVERSIAKDFSNLLDNFNSAIV